MMIEEKKRFIRRTPASFSEFLHHIHRTLRKENSMKHNMGFADRILRVIIVVVVAGLYFTDQISGIAAILLGILAVVFLLTSIVGFCPLYVPFKLTTIKKKDDENN